MLIVYKAFRYRVYPAPAQETRLLEWESALRWLWNLANEQRLAGLHRTDKRYPTAFDQQKELTDLRTELPWLADVPRNVCAQLLVELDKAWQRCFKKLGRAPRWKRKSKDFLGLIEPHPNVWRLDGSNIRFPKLGTLRTVLHRPLNGKPKTCTLKREGNQWFASILCEIESIEPIARIEPVVAIDRGITYLLADSNSKPTLNPSFYKRSMKRLARAQRVVSRRKKGSKNREKAKHRVMCLHRKVRRQREHFLHEMSAAYAKNHGTVVVENLNVTGMIRGRLSRSISDAGWTSFSTKLRYKLAWSGGQMVEVPAQYSSQTCSDCNVRDAASRKRERFNCTACGYSDHADFNAAKVLKKRYETPGNPWCLPAEGSLLEGSRRNRKAKVVLRTPSQKPRPSGRG